MATGKKYSVSELADLIGVPRTTINDWLTRYTQYIDFKLQGKRKIYLDSTVEVLKEISELRNSGLSSFDIEEELVKRHPVHGEVHGPGDSGLEGQEEGEAPPEKFAVIARKQTDEIAKLIGEHLQNIAVRIDDIETANRRANSRANRWYGFAVILALVFLIVGLIAAVKIEKGLQRNSQLKEKNLGLNNELTNTGKKLISREQDLKISSEKVVVLSKDNTKLKEGIDKLQKGLEKQQQDFNEVVKKAAAEADKAKAKETELFKLRDEFAKKQLELLKKLEATAKSVEEKELLVKKLQEQSLEQSKTIQNLTGKKIDPENAEEVE